VSSSSTSLPTPEGLGSVSEAEQGISRRRFTGLAGAALATGLAPAGTHAYAAGERGLKPPRRRISPQGSTARSAAGSSTPVDCASTR
jgi:hypothetical protein